MFNVDDQHTTPSELNESSHPQDEDMKEVYGAFGLEYPEPQEDDLKDNLDEEEESPPIESESESEEDPKGITVKYNGQDVFIKDEDVAVHARKGLNYDKIEGRAKQYETALDRLARQHGYKDHAELVANLDLIEQQQLQQQKDQFEVLKQQLRQSADEAGIDPDALDQYLDNHPLLQQAKGLIQRSEQDKQLREQELLQQKKLQEWEALFQKYPHLAEQVDAETGSAIWMTPEMTNRLDRGYDPVDAYEVVHKESIIAEERKRTEQSVLKNQRLNKRSQVEGSGSGELEPNAPAELTSAFAMFGIDTKKAHKYAKSFE